MGTLGTTHCLELKVKDAFIVVFPPEKHVAHIISSPTTLKTSSHLEQGAGTYYSGTQA